MTNYGLDIPAADVPDATPETTPTPPPKRPRGRPARPVYTPPTDAASARKLLALALTQPTPNLRFVRSCEVLLRSFETAELTQKQVEEIEGLESENTALKSSVQTLTAENTSLKAESEALRNRPDDFEPRLKRYLTYNVEPEQRKAQAEIAITKKTITALQEQVAELKRKCPEPPPKPVESTFEISDEEFEKQKTELDDAIAAKKRKIWY